MNVDALCGHAPIRRSKMGRGLTVIALSCLMASLAAKSSLADERAWAALEQGGVFVLMRHGSTDRRNAPRTFSPGNCERERNLSDKGRQEAARIGEAFRRRGISVTTVLASPYCRTTDTAQLAFGEATSWEPLTLTIGVPEGTAREWTNAVEQRIRQGAGAGNVVMVTHLPNLKALTKQAPAPAEMLVVQANEAGDLVVIGRITPDEAP